MRVSEYLRLVLLALVAATALPRALPVQAQPVQVNPEDVADDRPGDDDDREDEDDDDDDEDNDGESPTLQRQMQTLKRELRGQKADPNQTAPVRDGEHQFQLKVDNYIAI